MSEIATSLIRTVVPILVGAIVAFAASKGIDAGQYQDLLAQLVGAVVAALYYAVARFLETYVRPKFGWLLGQAARPTYSSDAA